MASIVRKTDVEASGQYISDLETKAAEAMNVSNVIGSIISESRKSLKGVVFDAFRTNLEVYKVAYGKLSKLCTILSCNIRSTNSNYNQYIDRCPSDACPVGGGPVNAAENIPYHEQKIAELEAENEKLAKVPKERFAGYDEKTGAPTYEPNEPEYTEAQNKIQANLQEIAHRKELIKYLQELDQSVDPAAVTAMEPIRIECEKFVKDVDAINVTTIV